MNDSFPTDPELVFDESNPNWSKDYEINLLFLRGVETHMNHLLTMRGHVFLNEIYDQLHFPRTRAGARTGWIYKTSDGEPAGIEFHRHHRPYGEIGLTFNVQGDIIDLI